MLVSSHLVCTMCDKSLYIEDHSDWARLIWANRDRLMAIFSNYNAILNNGLWVELSIANLNVNADKLFEWLQAHDKHDVRVQDESRMIDNRCNQRIKCNECDTEVLCDRRKNHDNDGYGHRHGKKWQDR